METKKKFKISIILECTYVSKSIFELVHSLKENPKLDINFILVPSNRKIYHSNLSYFKKIYNTINYAAWDLIQYLEGIYFKRYHEDYSKYHINFSDQNHVLNLQKNFEAEKVFSAAMEEILEDLNIDLMIALNMNPYCLSLKKFSKLGLIFFGDYKSENGLCSPLGFNEVYKEISKTGFSILRIKKNLDNFETIFRGAFPTHNYFLANHLNIIKRRNFYLKKYIFLILSKALPEDEIETYAAKDFGNFYLPPNIFIQSFYIFKSIRRRFASLRNDILKKEKFWKVGYTFSDWTNFRDKQIHLIENPTNSYLADPFVLNVENKNYLLAEDYNFDSGKGVIVAYELQGKNSRRIGKVIEEPFHMSFPFLFKFQEKIFMLPETSENNDIRIYESVKFPNVWKLNHVIMKNVFAVDSMIFNFQDQWWLLSNINPEQGPDGCSELCIYSSDNPLSGQWEPHQQNPVIVNSDKARNGGILFKDNKIYRVSQKQTFGRYGGEFTINEIIKLTKSEFVEKKIIHVKPNFIKKGLATHHCNSNNEITVFDFLT